MGKIILSLCIILILLGLANAIPPGPTANMFIPSDSGWAGCSLQTIRIAIVDENDDPVDTTTIQLRVEGTLYLWPHSQLDWVDDSVLIFTPATSFSNGQTVNVILEQANTTDGLPLQAGSYSWEFYMDFNFPFFLPETRYPPPGTTVCADVGSIAVMVMDTTSGIPYDGLCMCVDANNYNCSPNRSDGYCWQPSMDTNFVYQDSIFFVRWGYFSAFDDEDSITACLRKAVDYVSNGVSNALVCGPHWFDTTDVEQCWTFIKDCIGPRAYLIFPSEGDTTACDSIVIGFIDYSGVDTMLIKMSLTGVFPNPLVSESPDFNASPDGDTAYFIGTLQEGNISMRMVQVKDNAGNTATVGSFPIWSIYVDKSAPTASSTLPPDGSTVASSTPSISIAIDDEYTTVDPNSLQMQVDGTYYSYPHPALSWDGSRLTFSPSDAGISFSDGDTVDVCLESACDIVSSEMCGPNCMSSPYCWSFRIDQGGPQAELILPPDSEYTACPDQELIVRIWDQSGVDSMTIELQVESTTYDSMEQMTYSNDTLVFTPSSSWTNGQEVNWALLSAEDILGNPLATPISGLFYVDIAPPFVSDVQPNPGTRFGPLYLVVLWTLIDPGAGVDPNSATVNVQGYDYPYPGGFSWDGTDLTFDLAFTGLSFTDGETVQVCLHIGDSILPQFCGPNWRDTCTYFIADLAGPIADMVYPPESTITACDDGTIKIYTSDIDGIDQTSVQLRINGTSYFDSSSEISWNWDTLIFTPSTSFAHGDTITVELVTLNDTLGNNISSTYSWIFYMDTQPPELTSYNPPHGGDVSSSAPTIRFWVSDDMAGVDTTSILIRVAGVEYSVGDPGCTWSTGQVVFDCGDAGLSFSDGDTVDVCFVSASDKVSSSLCGPNTTNPDSCWYFVIDLAGPTTDLLRPLDGAWTSCPEQDIWIYIYDEQGILPESTAIRVNDDTLVAWLGEITMNGDTAMYNPAVPFGDGEEITVQVVHATDSLGNTTTGGDIWTFIVDLSPPVWFDTDPLPESFLSSPSPIVQLYFADSTSGVNPTSFEITVEGSPYIGMLPGISWIDPAFEIDLGMLGYSFSDGDTIDFCFNYLEDMTSYCPPNALSPDSCWEYYVDLTGPTAEIIRPDDSVFFACESGTLIIALFDNFGIVDSTVRLLVSGVSYSILSPQMWIIDDTIYFHPTSGWLDGDTIIVSVSAAEDIAGNPITSDGPWQFYIDISGPQVISADPPGGTMLSESSPILIAEIQDVGAGVQSASITVTVDGSPLSSGVSYDPGTNTVTVDFSTAGLSYSSGDTIQICYSADDMVLPQFCGPNAGDSACFMYSFDLLGPQAYVIEPIPDSYSSCDDQNIFIHLTDDFDVNNSSIHLRVNGDEYILSDTNLIYIGDSLLQFYPPIPFPEGEITVVLWGVTDNTGNSMSGDSLVFSFHTDYTPPYITSTVPIPGAVVPDTEITIQVGFSDDGSGVRDSSIVFTVTGAVFTMADGCLAWDGSIATLTLPDCGVIFADGDTIDVCARASDNPDYCSPNTMSDSCWSFLISSEGPVVEILEPNDGQISACDNQPIFILITDGNGIDQSSIQLTVDGITYTTADPELSFFNDSLRFIPSINWSDGDTISVTLISVDDIVGTSSSDVPLSWQFVIDLSPPYASGVNPPDGTFFSVGDADISVALTDDLSGVNPTTIRLMIGPFMYSYPSGDMNYDGDSLRFSLSGMGITPLDGDSLTICVQNTEDSPDLCTPNTMTPYCFSYYFDYRGPQVNLMFPPESVYVSCIDSMIIWTVWDAAGVDSVSVQVNIDGTPIDLTSPYLSLSGTYLRFDPDTTFWEGELFPVEVTSVEDGLGNSTGPFTWWVGFDTTGPEISNPDPPDDGVVSSATPIISVQIDDNASGIYPYWARMIINDMDTVRAVLGDLNWDGSRLWADLASLSIYLPGGETTTVCVDSVFDEAYACGKNQSEQFCWSFRVDEGGPLAILLSPPDEAISSCDQDSIIIRLRDNNGIDWSATSISVDGSEYSVPSVEVFILDDSTVAFVPSSPFDDGDTIEFFVVESADTLGHLGSAYPHWRIVIDTSPPFEYSLFPADGEFIENYWLCVLRDITAGVDTESIEVLMDGTPTPFSLTEDSVELDISGISFADTDSVQICITAQDLVNWCEPNIFDRCYNYYIDRTAPEGELLTPIAGAISACDDQQAIWIISDYFGIDVSSIVVVIDGDTVGIDAPELNFSDDSLIYSPSGLSDGDTVHITLVSVTDEAGNTASLDLSTWYVIDLSPPELVGSDPAYGSEVGDPEPTIRLFIEDEIAGVNSSTITVIVNGTPTPVAWDGSAVIINCSSLGIEFDDGDTVIVCVSVEDNPDLCDANVMTDTCIQFYINLSGPIARIVSPTNGTFVACQEPEQQIIMTISDPDGVDDTTITFMVNGDTFYIDDVELNYFDDTLVFVPSSSWSDGDTINCTLLFADDMEGNGLASPISWSFVVDLTPPIFGLTTPSAGEIVSDLSAGISIQITDDGAGVDTTSIALWIAGETDTFTISSGLIWDGIFATIPESLLLAMEDTVIVCVSAQDQPDYCEPNVTDTFCWFFIISSEGPIAQPVSPQNGQFISCQEGEQILIIYLHSDDGIDETSIQLEINSTTVIGTYSNDTLSYIPSTPWGHGDTIRVSLYAEDIYGVALDSPLEYWFVIDTMAPTLDFSSTFPIPAAIMTVGLWDNPDGAGIDTASIEITFRTLSYPADTIEPHFSYSDDTLSIDLLSADPIIFFGDTVEICITVGDLAEICGANTTERICIYDTIPPIEIMEPIPGSITACNNQSILLVLPVPTGVADFLMLVDGDSVGIADVEITGDTIFYTPSSAFASGETVSVHIISAFDDAGLEIIADSVFQFVVDLEPPMVFSPSPAPGTYITMPSPNISAVLTDSIAGVDTVSIIFIIAGDTFTVDSTGVNYSDDILSIDCADAGIVFASGETVEVCINAADMPDYCPPNEMDAPFCWVFYVSFEGPSASLIAPPRGYTVACEDTQIIILIEDEDGIDETTIQLRVEGIIYTVDSSALSFSNDTLRYDISSTFDGDTINFSLISASDLLGNLLASTLNGWFIFDIGTPVLESWGPTITSDTNPVIWFLLNDTVSGIDWASLSIIIGASVWETSSPAVTLSGDTLYLDCEIAGIEFEIGDTNIQIIVSDQPDYCAPNTLDTTLTITILPAGDRPIATLIQPDSGAVISCDGGNIQFVVQGVYPIITDSLGLIIGDSLPLVWADSPPGLSVSGDTVSFNLPTTFSNGDTVHFSPLGYDIYFNPVMAVDWYFIVDTEPPTYTLNQPISPVLNSLAVVEIEIEDNIAGVNPDSISATIITPRGDWVFTIDSTGADWNGTVFTIQPDIVNGSAPWTPDEDTLLLYFHENETIYVEVQACDSALLCGQNCSIDTMQFYTIDDDTLPPEIIDWSPESVIAGDNFELYIYADDTSGLGPCCFAIINGETLDVIISPQGDSFLVSIPGLTAPAPGETLWVQIQLCDDDIDFENSDDRKSVSFDIPVIAIAGEGPIVQFIQPLENEYTSCDSGPVLAIISDPDGVDVSSVVFMEGAETLLVSWNADTAIISPTAHWNDGEEITVALTYCEDLIGNPGDTGSVSFIVDISPPIITLVSPDTGLVEQNSIVELDISDNLSGIASAYMLVNSDSVPLHTHNPIIILEDYITQGETLRLEIYSCDSAVYCGNNCSSVEYWFLLMADTPCDAHPIPFTPNDDGKNDLVYFDYPEMIKTGATISILNLDGLLVREIELGPCLPGTVAFWDGTDQSDNPLPPGIYVYTITRDGKIICKGTIALAR